MRQLWHALHVFHRRGSASPDHLQHALHLGELLQQAVDVLDGADEVDPSLDEGVYVQFPGPHYETPAEVRMAGVLGGDLVGMSTTLEAIAAREAGMEVLGISLVTNLAAGISGAPLNHEEVLEAGRAAADRMGTLLATVLPRI